MIISRSHTASNPKLFALFQPEYFGFDSNFYGICQSMPKKSHI